MYWLVIVIVIVFYNSFLLKYVLRLICFLFFLVIMKYEFILLMFKNKVLLKLFI